MIINEDIDSGLIQNQVINPIKQNSDKKIDVINIHKFYKKIRTNGLRLINIPLAIPARLFMFNLLFFTTPFIASIYSLILSFIVEKESIIVSRSYFSTLVAYYLQKIKKNKFIFDSRSLFIDESTLNGTINYNSLNYKMWKYFEKKFLQKASKTIAVSKKQAEVYKQIHNQSNIDIIPCYISSTEIRDNQILDDLRHSLDYKDDDIIVSYYGSLNNGWNNLDMYLEAFKRLIEKGIKVLIISQDYNRLKNDSRLYLEGITLLNTNRIKANQLPVYLQICDYGIVLMKKKADWETRLSVKFVEYLNNGLQVIVGEHVGEAVRYAKESFAHRCIILSDNNDGIVLNHKVEYSDDNLIRYHFGLGNFKKVFDIC